MNDSLSHWLALREPADIAARSLPLTRAVIDTTASNEPLEVLDLGTGTGANLRYLAARLPQRQRWLVTDFDANVLADLPERTSQWGAARGYDVRADAARFTIRGVQLDCEVSMRCVDLNTLSADLFAGRHLVTASALLDLASAQWLRALAAQCRAAGAAVLFALSYDGRSTCTPAEPEDEMIRELLNRHQLKNERLGGAAAGPAAEEMAARAFTEEGYHVLREQTDWVLGNEYAALQRELISGWARPALELAPERAASIASWQQRRLAHLAAGRSTLVVGHHDLGAWLPDHVTSQANR
jgi:SAM-dependent methyltransferase